jgi:hypothetical protein
MNLPDGWDKINWDAMPEDLRCVFFSFLFVLTKGKQIQVFSFPRAGLQFSIDQPQRIVGGEGSDSSRWLRVFRQQRQVHRISPSSRHRGGNLDLFGFSGDVSRQPEVRQRAAHDGGRGSDVCTAQYVETEWDWGFAARGTVRANILHYKDFLSD